MSKKKDYDKTKEILKEQKKKNEEKAKKALDEYKNFAMKGNVIDLAIGVVIGSAFTNIVNTLVSAIITPIISLLTNDVDLSTLFITLKGGHFDTLAEAKAAGAITLDYGTFLNAIINFLIISIVLFIVFRKIMKSNRNNAKEEAEIKEVTTKTCPYCMSTIPIEASKCAYCTSSLENIPETKT